MARKKPGKLTRREFLGGTGALLTPRISSAPLQQPATPEVAPDDSPRRLREIFENPPGAARPMTRWWWFGGAVTPEEITRELTFMREAGLRGVELQPVYPLEPDDVSRGIRNVPYFTAEWFELLRHTARETSRLGLQFDFTLGSGWPFGGPFIPVELAARRLRVLVEEAAGPGEFSWELTPHLVGEDRVVAVVAAPVLASQQPELSRSVVITDRIERHEEHNIRRGVRIHRWPVPDGAWRIYLFVDSPTGMQVKRPTLGMEGLVLDHFSREAMDLFLRAAGDRVLDRVEAEGIRSFQSVFCDSLEVYGADWTAKLVEEFKRRRGYDLEPYLPALWQEAGPETPHVRYDYHLTLSELMLDNFFRPLAEWSRKRGVTSRVQAHGAFADIIESYALADIPEGETIFLGDRYEVNLRHRRLASSAAHLYGKPLVSAETYTWLRLPLYLVTLEMMKAATDAVFLDGINRIVNHGYPYSPPQAGQPGWAFYASTLINHSNLWWRHYPYLARYVHRVSALLREGVAVNQVAVYVPLADVFAKYGCGALHMDVEIEAHLGPDLFLELRRAGYDFDLVNDRALAELARVEDGKLRAGTGEYSAVIVPHAQFMPPESMERLAEFAESGGLVLFVERVPKAAPGLNGQEQRTARVRAALRRLFPEEPEELKPGEGRRSRPVMFAENPVNAVRQLRGRRYPDFRIARAGVGSEEALAHARENVGFVQRRAGDTDYFFVTNVSNRVQNLMVYFGVGQRRPERWNPETGETDEELPFHYALAQFHSVDVTGVQLRLLPFESCFIVFRNSEEPPLVNSTSMSGGLRVEKRGSRVVISGLVEKNGDYSITWGRLDRGRVVKAKGIPPPVTIEGPWNLTLGENATVQLAGLRSWNELPEGKSYSGWAKYETTFEIPEVGRNVEWVLDLGAVHETAEATLNGVNLGAAWKAPRRLPCGTALRAGMNHLVVEVANLWIHYVQSLPKPDLGAVAETHGIRWGTYGEVEPETVPPSGLLGPVRLVPRKRVGVTL